MHYPIVGSEEIAAGRLTRGQLRWNYTALHPDVYLHNDAPRTESRRILAAYLWTKRKGIVTGRAAAWEYGVYWALKSHDVDLIAPYRRPTPGVEIHDERISDDEIRRGNWLTAASPARTALDVARRLPLVQAVAVLDALAAKNDFTKADVRQLIDRYAGMRGLPAAREAVSLMDAGSHSREESALRVGLVTAGIPTPTTDIHVEDESWSARIAMGWEWAKVGVSVEPGPIENYAMVQFLRTEELIQRLGWIHVRAHPRRTPHSVGRAVHAALVARGLWRRARYMGVLCN
ncbi:hypothetical protein [Mycobacterium sp. GA-2829]|uniref:hypothetical protein n=1 Tax=Mycobacterium sp. GA-2829 TaxID=1772283 RepID=UPI00073FCD51|nr:hypothetical protein [Mycobacterium sp. GA-2829]KUI39199.1 hypothetical protein AU194_14300 [Mycobacterium sp. GA-2829]